MFAVRDTPPNPLATLPCTPLTSSPVRGMKRALEDDDTFSDTNHQLGACNPKMAKSNPTEWRGRPSHLFDAQNHDDTMGGDNLGLTDDTIAIAKIDSVGSMTQRTLDDAVIRPSSPHRQASRLSHTVGPATDSKKDSKTRFILKLSLRSRQLRVVEKNDEIELPLSTFKFTFEMPVPPRPVLPHHKAGSFHFTFAPPPKIMLRIKIPIDISLSIRMSKKLKLA